METLKCPSCGSPDLEKIGDAEYKCHYCGTGFILKLSRSPTHVDVILTQTGERQRDVIEAIRINTELDLRTAKQITDAPPAIVARCVTLAEGESLKAKLEQAGATVELRPV